VTSRLLAKNDILASHQTIRSQILVTVILKWSFASTYLHKIQICLQPCASNFFVIWSYTLLRGVAGSAREDKKTSDIPNRLNYCVIFIEGLYALFTNMAAGYIIKLGVPCFGDPSLNFSFS
jgi:hypothetical protein